MRAALSGRMLGIVAVVCMTAALPGNGSGFAAVPVRDQTPPVAVLVELFTAEGCSSCPPADALLEAMLAKQPAPGALIVGLGEHVDYWNQLGWRDRFSSSAMSARQRSYAKLGDGDLYTPQMVVDGTAAFVGTDLGAARHAIDRARSQPHGTLQVELSRASDRDLDIAVTAANMPAIEGDRAELLVAVTEDSLRSEVKRGENAGRILTHAAVVRALTSLGDIGVGRPVRGRIEIKSDWDANHLKIVAFAQARRGRRILATSVVLPPLPPSGGSPDQ
jgi:hypothetical protein